MILTQLFRPFRQSGFEDRYRLIEPAHILVGHCQVVHRLHRVGMIVTEFRALNDSAFSSTGRDSGDSPRPAYVSPMAVKTVAFTMG